MTKSLTVQAAYVGQHSDHLAAIYDMGQNFLLPNGTAIPGPYLAGNPALKNDGTGQQRLNTSTAIQNYNALQTSAQQRLAKGLAFQFNYTWSKCLTNNQGYYGRYGDSAASQTTADVSFQAYVYNVTLDYGLCDADVTNVFTGYLNYDLPFGHGRAVRQECEQGRQRGSWRLALRRHRHRAWRPPDFDDPVRQRSHRRLLPAASGLHRAFQRHAL